MSLSTSIIPSQWKQARIRPVRKVPVPIQSADYRPISITPILTRIMERMVVTQYIYPSLLAPPSTLTFADQFAFRPTGSTTAAIITILDHITRLLVENPYVIVIAIDFTKAFDTVRHATLVEKLAMLNLPDNVCNWLSNFFSRRSHCTMFQGDTSSYLEVSASIIQGSAVGPAAYVVTAADLCPITSGNEVCKYADGTYLIIPASNVNSRAAELQNVESWASANNLRLNRSKTIEIVFKNRRCHQCHQPPPDLPGIARTTIIKILGVTFTGNLSMSDHVQNVLNSCSQTLYALKTLRAHGLPAVALQNIYRSVILAKVMYASSAWSGFMSQTDRQRIDSFLQRGKRCGFCPADVQDIETLCQAADDKLFKSVLINSNHLLQRLLPDRSEALLHYNLRRRPHDRQLPDTNSHLARCNFISRQLFNNVY